MTPDNPTPQEIVDHLDKYIIGQANAKKSVAIALRNRWRRQQAPDDIRQEIMPNNIIMIGPTGVGKTEIARRLADHAKAPFIKVEASKFTEVGYVGRDVESMVRDLVEIAVNMIRQEQAAKLEPIAKYATTEKLLDLLVGPVPKKKPDEEDGSDSIIRTRERFRRKLEDGELEDREVEIDVPQKNFPMVEVFSPMGIEEMGPGFQEVLSNIMPQKSKRRKLTVSEARRHLLAEETEKLTNQDEAIATALERVQESGIIFVDEIDKICDNENRSGGPDVSREGVQRDILPIVEGSAVMTKYGMVHTDHILFIAAGAFHGSRPSDLIPELQGRFPIRVELDSLTAEDFEKILTEPQTALTKQYQALMKTEGVDLSFTKDGVKKIAQIAEQVNTSAENIGARRLHTVMTTLLEDILFEPPKSKKKVSITGKIVTGKLKDIVEDEDLSRYIL